MPGPEKYTDTLNSLDGLNYVWELIEQGYNDEPTVIQTGQGGVQVRWGTRSKNPHLPILASVAEVSVFDRENVIQSGIFNADENKYLLRIKKNGNNYWTGKVLTNLLERSLDLQKKSSLFRAIDGLGTLQNVDFTLTGRKSIVKTIAETLALTGLNLQIHTAFNWFTPEIDPAANPLAVLKVDCDLWRQDDGQYMKAYEVLEEILERFGLQLYQENTIWKVIQREVKIGTYKIFVYDTAGDPVTTIADHDPAVTITTDVQHAKRLSSGAGSALQPFLKTSVRFQPKTNYRLSITNGSFEITDDVGPPFLEDWTIGGSVISTSRLLTDKVDGDASLRVVASHIQDTTEIFLPTDFIETIPGKDAVGIGHALRFHFSAKIEPAPSLIFNPEHRKRLFYEIQVGDYFLKRDSFGVTAWEHKDTIGVAGVDPDRYIKFNILGLSGSDGWTEDIITSPVIDQLDGGGLIRIRLYELNDNRFSSPSEDKAAANYWDKIFFEVLPAGEEGTGLETVTTDIVSDNVSVREPVELNLGDGFSTATRSTITVNDDVTVTRNWKRGAYGELDEPTGKSLDKILAESYLRAQKVSPLDEHHSTYRRRTGLDLEIGNVLVIGTKRYVPVEFERDLKKGHATGTWIELREDDTDIDFTEINAPGLFQSGSATEAALISLSKRVAFLSNNLPVTILRAAVLKNVEITSIPISVIGEAIFKSGDIALLVSSATAKPFQLTVSANQGANDNTLAVAAFTPDQDISLGSAIFYSQKELRSMIIQTEDAITLLVGDVDGLNSRVTVLEGEIVLKVEYGELASSLTIELESITVDTNVLKSDNWNGTIDGSGNITVAGSVGWAITGAGNSEFNNITARGSFRTGTGAKRIEILSSSNEMAFYEGSTQIVLIGSNVESISPGILIWGGGTLNVLGPTTTSSLSVTSSSAVFGDQQAADGKLKLWSSNIAPGDGTFGVIQPISTKLTANRTYQLPDQSGTIALTSDIPSVPVDSVFGRTGSIVAAANDYTWAQINKATSSLADITTRSAGDLSSGTLPTGRLSGSYTGVTGVGTLTEGALGAGFTAVADAQIASSVNWNTAYTDRMKWDGGATGLNAATGRSSLGLGSMALKNTGESEVLTWSTAAGDYLIAATDGVVTTMTFTPA